MEQPSKMSNLSGKMDFHSVIETFAEAWVAANTHTPLTVAAEQGLISSSTNPNTVNHSPINQIHSQPVLTSLPEALKKETENGFIIENSSLHKTENVPMVENSSLQQAENVPIVENSLLQQTENISIVENNREVGRQSPIDCSSNCSVGEIRPKGQEFHGKCLPVHCIIEQIPGPQACGQFVELDSYAIVPCDTLFSDLVRTTLGKLGYSGSQIVGAKGSIQVKKWKPLAFDQITENPEATVGDILSELTTMASLRVRLYSVPDNPEEWRDVTVRNAVLELLREMSQIKLAKLCPLSQPMLSNIINNRYMGKIGKEKCQEFGLWYLTYRKENPERSIPEVVPNDKPADGRLTFHPTKELPVMRDWFHSCRNPSRRTLQLYVDILNQGPIRQQERPKVAFSTLKNWWKNEKQRERKQQKSDDSSLETTKPKRRRKSENINNQSEASTENPIQNYSGSSVDSPTKTNTFTLINHSENDSDSDRFSHKDNTTTLVNESSHDFHQSSPLTITKENRFNVISQDDHSNGVHPENRDHITHPIKDTLIVESPYFQKLHPVCIDHSHGLFSFHDNHLSMPNNTKVFCNTEAISGEGNNSRLSSEEDVDVGI